MAGTIINSGVLPIIGISDLTLVRVLSDTRTEFTTDDPNMIDMRDKVVSRAYTPQNVDVPFYSSNKLAVSFKTNKGGSLNLVISDLSPEERKAILASSETAEGVTFATGNDAPPEYVVAYRVKKAKGVWELQKFAKVVFSAPTENAQTESDSPAAQTTELIGIVVPLNFEVSDAEGNKKNGAFQFTVDSTNEKFSDLEAQWFTKGTAGIVQTPAGD